MRRCLSVRGTGGEAASVRVTNLGQVAWFDGATKIRTTPRFRPGTWYRITVRVDQARRTYDLRVSTDGGTRVASAARLSWRMPAVKTVGSVCGQTSLGAPRQTVDFADVSVVQTVTP